MTLLGTDPEDVIKNAFGCFDEEGTGLIHEDRLRELLTTMGDRFTDAEVSRQTALVSSCHPTIRGAMQGSLLACKWICCLSDLPTRFHVVMIAL